MDGFKNTTKMKYMSGGPVRMATGGMMKSAAPKGASNALTMAPKGGAPKAAKTTGAAASLSSALGTLSAASKTPKSAAPESVAKSAAGTKMGVMPTDLVKKGASPTGPLGSVRKPNVQPLPPKDAKTMGGAPRDVKTMGGAPKDAKTMGSVGLAAKTMGGAPKAPKDVGRELPRPTMEPKRLIAQTPPEDGRTIGGAPKSAKTMGGEPRRSDEGISAKRRLAGTAGDYAAPPEDVRTIGGAPKGAKTMGSVSPAAKTMGSVSPAAKTMGSVSPAAKRGVPVASNKPMIGFKTGGHVTKSSFKW